jgi:hypothetical protein
LNREQLDHYLLYNQEIRIKRAKKIAKLKKKNATKDDLLDAQVGVL